MTKQAERTPRRRIAMLMAGILLAIPVSALPAEEDASWLERKPVAPLWIVSQDARCWQFRVWLAITPEEFSRGLMYVKDLPEDVGMLFGMGGEREISMWMRNTYIPLDIVFADSSGTIVRIHENAEPLSLDHISSGQAVLAVLELPGGTTRQRGIRPGDKLRQAHFGNSGCQDD